MARAAWRGYGTGPQHVFRSVLLGVPWRRAASELFRGAGSYGNGGAMRVAPTALLGHRLERVVELARRSARLTHLHPVTVGGAVLQAVAVALAVSSDRECPLDRERFLDARTRNAEPARDDHPSLLAARH